MARYRLYAFDDEWRFARAADFECSTDQIAAVRAIELSSSTRPAALWRIGHSGSLIQQFK